MLKKSQCDDNWKVSHVLFVCFVCISMFLYLSSSLPSLFLLICVFFCSIAYASLLKMEFTLTSITCTSIMHNVLYSVSCLFYVNYKNIHFYRFLQTFEHTHTHMCIFLILCERENSIEAYEEFHDAL